MTSIAGLTDVGNRSGENQDSIGWDEARAVALVADGLGGHRAGQVASAIVSKTVLDVAGSVDLRTAVLRAHAAVALAAEDDEAVQGMASTIVAVQIARRSGIVVWVGDSRAYLWRGKALTRMTQDHSVVEELRISERLSETQLRAHPLRHEITQVLGAGDPQPDRIDIPLRTGDWILLCSDGLSGELWDEEIAEVLRAAPSLTAATQSLIAAALENGGRDNVSAVLVEYDGPSKRRLPLRLSEGAITWLAVLSGVVLAVAMAGAVAWFHGRR